MPLTCFSYPADVPLGTRNRNAVQATLRDDVRRMPHSCFSYPADVPRSMPFSCFSYPVGAPLGAGNRGAAKSAPLGLRRMPAGSWRSARPRPSRPSGRSSTSRPDPIEPPASTWSWPAGSCFKY